MWPRDATAARRGRRWSSSAAGPAGGAAGATGPAGTCRAAAWPGAGGMAAGSGSGRPSDRRNASEESGGWRRASM
eukprot:7207300-Alexandrium_andersonii.AAC.1